MFRNKLLVTLAAAVALTGVISVSGAQAVKASPIANWLTKTITVKTVSKNNNETPTKVYISKTNNKCTLKPAAAPAPAAPAEKPAAAPAPAAPAEKPAAAPAPAAPAEKPAAAPAPAAPAEKPAAAPAPAAPAEKPAAAPAPAAQISVSAYEKKVAELVNQERAKQGLKPLTLDAKLSDVARTKSQDMKDKNYFSHTSPTYGSPFDMMKKFGITYRTAGENIAKGQRTPEEVMNAWMNSDGHRKNILSPNFTHIGIGYVASGNIWTQMFIGK